MSWLKVKQTEVALFKLFKSSYESDINFQPLKFWLYTTDNFCLFPTLINTISSSFSKLGLTLHCCVFLRYVSRYHVKDSARHVILGTQQFKPNEFASQINLSMENAWGILRCVIDICRKLDEGKYLILKDPNKVSLLSLYSHFVLQRFIKASCFESRDSCKLFFFFLDVNSK